MSGAGGAAASSPALPSVPIDADVVEIVDESGTTNLMPAVAAVEKIKKIDKEALDSIGIGATDATVFFDMNTAIEKRDWMVGYVRQMVAADGKGIAHFGRDRGFTDRGDKINCVLRAMRKLLDLLAKNRLPGAKEATKITVVSGDAEDAQYSKEFDGTWLEQLA